MKTFFRRVIGNSRSKWAFAVVLIINAGCATLSIGGLTSEYPGYTITDLKVTQKPYQAEVNEWFCSDKAEQHFSWKTKDFKVENSIRCQATGGHHMVARVVGRETKFSDEYTVQLESPGKNKTVEEKVSKNLFDQLKVGQTLTK